MIIPYYENLAKKEVPITLKGRVHTYRAGETEEDRPIAGYITPSGKPFQEMDAHQDSEFHKVFKKHFYNILYRYYYQDNQTVLLNDITTPKPYICPFGSTPNEAELKEIEDNIQELPRTNDDIVLELKNIRQWANSEETDNNQITKLNLEYCKNEINKLQFTLNFLQIGDIEYIKKLQQKYSNIEWHAFRRTQKIEEAATEIITGQKKMDPNQFKTWDELFETEDQINKLEEKIKSSDPFFQYYYFLGIIEQRVYNQPKFSGRDMLHQNLIELLNTPTYTNLYNKTIARKQVLERYKILLQQSPNLKKPILEFFREGRHRYKDFMVSVFGFDLVSSVLDKTIITSRRNPEEAFREYYPKGWKIQQVPKMVLDPSKNEFVQLLDLGSIGRPTKSEAQYYYKRQQCIYQKK